ncbi:MAG: hypothetical protein HZB67_04640 [Candidatus Aenigmarchaeota archaeon]|nr:hypothetical protein [Candidatus Aenigmarchaeota archaeon]
MSNEVMAGYKRIFDFRDVEFLFTSLGLLLTKGPMTEEEIYQTIGKHPDRMGSLSAIAYRLPIDYVMERCEDGRLHATEEGRQLYRSFEAIGKHAEISNPI